jgi:quinol monooxygenase YgiN
VKATLADPGCVLRECRQDLEGSSAFSLVETWRDLAALEFPLRQPHFIPLANRLPQLLAQPPTVSFTLKQSVKSIASPSAAARCG